MLDPEQYTPARRNEDQARNMKQYAVGMITAHRDANRR